jgi:hypothetical protein
MLEPMTPAAPSQPAGCEADLLDVAVRGAVKVEVEGKGGQFGQAAVLPQQP